MNHYPLTPNTVTAPVPFAGTEAEREANFLTHAFYDDRCMNCDCRPWGEIKNYPCGAEVAYEERTL